MKPNDTDKKVMPEPSNLGAALSLMSSGQGWGGQRRENNVHPTKEERDQWRERLSSPYTCFDAAHADFTIRLLDALEEAEEDRRRLELEADWLAQQCAASGWCPFSADKASCDYRTTQNVKGMCLCMDANKTTSCWDQAAEEKAKR